MLDKVIYEITDLVASQSSDGYTFEQFWSLIESTTTEALRNSQLTKPLAFDKKYKEYIWTILKENSNLIYTENDKILDIDHLTLHNLELKSDTLKVIATVDCQDRIIYGHNKAGKKSLTDTHILVLNTIAKAQYQGISQTDLAEKLDMTHKVVFYYVKGLEQNGLIVKEDAYADKRLAKLLYIKFFAKSNNTEEQDTHRQDVNGLYRISVFIDKVKQLLEKAENNTMALKDCINSIGFTSHKHEKWARVRISVLHDQGIVERFVAYDGKRHLQSVRLVKNHTTNESVEQHEPAQLFFSTKQSNNHNQGLVLFRDVPFEYQIYQDVKASSENGMTRTELAEKYPAVDPLLIRVVLDAIVKPPNDPKLTRYILYKVSELSGRIRVFRYFTFEGFQKYSEKMGKTATEIIVGGKNNQMRLETLVEPTSVYTINSTNKNASKREREEIDFSEPCTKKTWKSQASDEVCMSVDTDIPINNVTVRHTRSKTVSSNHTETNGAELNIDNSHKPKTASNIFSETSKVSIKNTNISSANTQAHKYTNISEVQSKKPFRKRSLDSTCDLSKSNTEEQANEPDPTPNHNIFEPIEYPSKSPRSKKKAKKDITIDGTKTRRIATLLDMLDKQNVWELNDLFIEFNNIEIVSGQRIARATFSSLTKKLHQDRKLIYHVISVQKPILGTTDIKTFLLHIDLAPESEKAKELMNSYDIAKQLSTGGAKKRQFRQERVQALPEINPQPPSDAAATIVVDNTWRGLAVNLGWMNSKWIRAKEVHLALFDYYMQQRHEKEEKEGRVVNMTEFLKQLSLGKLLRFAVLCCQESDHRTLAIFLRGPNNHKTPLTELPSDVRSLVFESHRRIKRAILQTIEIMHALGLIKPVDYEIDTLSQLTPPPKVELLKAGIVCDYRLPSQPAVSHISLDSEDDVNKYWKILHRINTEPYQNPITEEADVDIILAGETATNKVLSKITQPRSWTVKSVIENEQKAVLDSFIDMETMTVPEKDIPLTLHLIRTTGLSSKEIRMYYESVKKTYHKVLTRREKEQLKQERLKRATEDDAINELVKASLESRTVVAAADTDNGEESYQNNKTHLFLEPTFVGSRKFRKRRGLLSSGRKNLPRNSDALSELEKELLLYSFCIMKVRAQGAYFYWSPISKVFSSRTSERYRRLFSDMMTANPDMVITVDKLKLDWAKYYQEGIEQGEIQDECPWDTRNFDLLSHLEYFIKRNMQENLTQQDKAENCLPKSYTDLLVNWNIERDPGSVDKRKCTLYVRSLNINHDDIYDAPTTVTELNNKDQAIQLVMTLIKMILMTSEKSYNTKDAYELLALYPEDIIEAAVGNLKKNGTIIQYRSQYNRIPGRMLNVSDKFVTFAAGTLPFRFFQTAYESYQKISENEGTLSLTQKNTNAGMTAAVFDLLSQKKISIQFYSRDKYIVPRQSLSYPKPSAFDLLLSYLYKDLGICIKKYFPLPRVVLFDSTDSNTSVCDKNVILPASNDQAKRWLQSLKTKKGSPIELVYKAVDKFKEMGASFSDIHNEAKLLTKQQHTISESSVNLYLDKMMKCDPPLVRLVGLKQLRYVASRHCSNWFIKTNDTNCYLNPLMWYDPSRTLIKPAFEGWTNLVLSNILKNPGISHAKLREKLDEFVTAYELYTILNYLVQRNAIIERKIGIELRPKIASIFKPRVIKCVTSKGANCNEISHYWLAPDYYLSSKLGLSIC